MYIKSPTEVLEELAQLREESIEADVEEPQPEQVEEPIQE
jgi:hypothetical protein